MTTDKTQEEKGGVNFLQKSKHFCSQILEILIGLQFCNYSPLLLFKYDFYVTSA